MVTLVMSVKIKCHFYQPHENTSKLLSTQCSSILPDEMGRHHVSSQRPQRCCDKCLHQCNDRTVSHHLPTHIFQTLVNMASHSENMTGRSPRPLQLSFPLPKAPGTSIHLQLTILASSILLFLTTTMTGDSTTTVPLGSFVYALPDVGIHIKHSDLQPIR